MTDTDTPAGWGSIDTTAGTAAATMTVKVRDHARESHTDMYDDVLAEADRKENRPCAD